MVAPVVFAGRDAVGLRSVLKIVMRTSCLVGAAGDLFEDLVGQLVFLGQFDAFLLQGVAKLLLGPFFLKCLLFKFDSAKSKMWRSTVRPRSSSHVVWSF